MDPVYPNRYAEAAGPEDLPWYYPEPDPDLMEVFDLFVSPGMSVCSFGSGPARHEIELVKRGCKVICVDGVARAREMAQKLAEEHGVTLSDYLVSDILDFRPTEEFDIIFDRACLHTMDGGDRTRWRRRVLDLLRPGGHLILKALAPEPQRDWGPTGLSERALIELLGGEGLTIIELRKTRFQREEPHLTHTVVAQRV